MTSYGIAPEDYVEPRCVLCGDPYGAEPKVKPVPQERIIRKMDDYMAKRDYEGAERHLLYWLTEAELGEDLRGQLMLRNELTGHYRKIRNREKAIENAEKAIALLDELEFEGTISSGTTYVNAATAYNAFGENERSLFLFEKAREVYEASEKTDKALLGGLYNNMALTCVAVKKYREAQLLYDKALNVMAGVPDGRLEQAITYLNIADLYEEMEGPEKAEAEVFNCLDKACDLLSDDNVAEPGYYAFVCEKCAPVFDHYGYFGAAKEYARRAEEIYERLGQE